MKLENSNINGNTILKVYKTTFMFDGILMEGYTANEPDPDHPGKYINYLSSSQSATSVGKPSNTTIHSRIGRVLKSLLGEDFTTIQGKYKNESGAYSHIDLWRPKHVVIFWLYQVFKGNRSALNKLVILATYSLNQIIDDSFDREAPKKNDAWIWVEIEVEKSKERTHTKYYWNFLKRIAKDWYQKYKPIIYIDDAMISIADQINIALFGKNAKTIREEMGLYEHNAIRDYMNAEALHRIRFVEELAMRLIKTDKYEPIDAVGEAIRICNFDVMDYKKLDRDVKLESEYSPDFTMESIDRNLEKNIRNLQYYAERQKFELAIRQKQQQQRKAN